MKTEIRGNGHGDKHTWKDLGTEQSNIPEYRSTLYQCQLCKIFFRHHYYYISDIFYAMKDSEIPIECSKKD
jgi:hypothetical protein